METTAPPPMPVFQPHPKTTCGLAVVSLVLGILGLFTLGLTGLPAVIVGHIGLAAIRNANGSLEGRGLALGGLITGYLSMTIPVLAIIASLMIPALVNTRHKADHARCVASMKNLSYALRQFEIDQGAFPGNTVAARDPRFAKLTGSDCLRQLEEDGVVKDLDAMLSIGNNQDSWFYFPDADVSAPDAPMLISPPIRDMITVLYVDSSIQQKPKSALAKIIQSSKTPPVQIQARK